MRYSFLSCERNIVLWIWIQNVLFICSGYYADSPGASSCTKCPGGSECSDPKVAPKQCSAGTYSADAAMSCPVCATGTLFMMIVKCMLLLCSMSKSIFCVNSWPDTLPNDN